MKKLSTKKGNDFSLGKGRVVLVIILILVSAGFSGFMTYQMLNIANSNEEIAQFKSEINQITQNKGKKVTVNQELKEALERKQEVSAVFTYNNDYNTSNPFKSLLKKKPKPKPKVKTENEVKTKEQVQPEPKPKPKPEPKPEPKPKPKPEPEPEPEPKPKKPEIKVLGIVGNENNQRAFLKIDGSESHMVREGQVIEGLVIKKITSHEIVIEKEGTDFSYHCGGDSCENIEL